MRAWAELRAAPSPVARAPGGRCAHTSAACVSSVSWSNGLPVLLSWSHHVPAPPLPSVCRHEYAIIMHATCRSSAGCSACLMFRVCGACCAHLGRVAHGGRAWPRLATAPAAPRRSFRVCITLLLRRWAVEIDPAQTKQSRKPGQHGDELLRLHARVAGRAALRHSGSRVVGSWGLLH